MSEWLKEHAWKACVGETPPWVRIPLSPPTFYFREIEQICKIGEEHDSLTHGHGVRRIRSGFWLPAAGERSEFHFRVAFCRAWDWEASSFGCKEQRHVLEAPTDMTGCQMGRYRTCCRSPANGCIGTRDVFRIDNGTSI